MKIALRLTLVMLAGFVIAAASTTQIWEQKTADDFEKGEAEGVSISSDGTIHLAPPLDLAFDTGEIYVWALARDSRGRIFSSGGNGGKVFVFTPGASPSGAALFFKAAEIEAHALAVDAADNVYVGSSPDGKVYKVTPEGKSSVFFDPKAKYIWSLAFDRRGNLWVATGDRGELFRVDPQGKGSVVYKGAGKHIRTLAASGEGVIAGTEGHARIVRIGADGAAFVLYDAPAREITSLAVAPDGAIYAAGIGAAAARGTQRSPAGGTPPMALPAGLEGMASIITDGGGIDAATLRALGAGPGPAAAAAQSSEVYRIGPDGYPRRIWKSDKATAFSLALAADGDVLVGTGDKGIVFKLQPDGRISSLLTRAGGSQVTALLADGARGVYAATSNLGRVYRLGNGCAKAGSFQSQVKDAVIFSKWGRLRWKASTPPGAAVKIYTRSGNTREPDSTWSPWSEALVQASGQQVRSPEARFFQWKAALAASDQGSSPALQSVEFAYLPRNVAPEINSIVIQPRDVAMERMPVFQDQQTMPQFTPTLPNSSAAISVNPPVALLRPTRTTTRKGWQTVTWDAHDENGDALLFSVYIKGEGEAEWKLMRDHVEESFLSWDTTNFPDGAYTVRIVASDAASNPAELALQTERLSELFYIDNTAPVVSDLRATAEGGGRVRVRFHAADSATLLSKAEYSVDGGQLHQVFPVDSIFDAEAKDFDFVINGIGPGEHTIAIKVADRSNNQSSAKALVTGNKQH